MLQAFFKNKETRETMSLAWPLVVTQLGHIVTGMVDNIFLGRIGTTEQAAGILSNNLFILLLVFTIGMSYATTPLVTAAHEKGDLNKKVSLFKNSLLLNFSVALICFLLLYFGSGFLYHVQQPHDVAHLAEPFFEVLIFSMLPISFFFVCKQYCEGLTNTKMALVISVVGNLINIVLNYALIYGEFGLPELGYIGSAWASFFARLFMGISFLVLVFRSPLTRELNKVYRSVRINLIDLKQLWHIGWNSAMQFTFEVAAFVIAGLMAGSFGKEQIDAHGIALSIASFTYMFGSGIGSAATIRAGIMSSQNDLVGVRAASKAAIGLVLIIMGAFGISFVLFNNYLPLVFSQDAKIVSLASSLLIIAAMFQLFDGMQVTIIGILRGLQDIKFPTYITLLGYWGLALPLAYFLAFVVKLEVIGIWIALLISLVFVALCLLWRLWFLVRGK